VLSIHHRIVVELLRMQTVAEHPAETAWQPGI
jgi:hypothetical protein